MAKYLLQGNKRKTQERRAFFTEGKRCQSSGTAAITKRVFILDSLKNLTVRSGVPTHAEVTARCPTHAGVTARCSAPGCCITTNITVAAAVVVDEERKKGVAIIYPE